MTEDYLQTTLKSVLKWFPEKLKTSVDGRQVEKSVDFDLIPKSATIDEVVDAMVRKQWQYKASTIWKCLQFPSSFQLRGVSK